MARPEVRALLRWGVAAALCAGAAQVAHAASLNGIDSETISSFSYPADIQPVDTNPPTIVATVEPVSNTFGWNNTAVTVTFTCDDAESGVATCTDPVTLSAEGEDQVVIGEATDNAGNEASVSVSVDIDLTAPTVVMSGVLAGASLPFVPPVTCTATDALSGVNGPCVVTFEYVGGLAFDAVGTARDFADNLTVVKVRFSVSAICAAPGVPDTTPCVVPPGYTIDDDLVWNADVQVFGTVTGKLEVNNGEIVIEDGGVVEDDLRQYGPGSIELKGGASVGTTFDHKIIETGDGDIILGDGIVATNGPLEESGNGSIYIDGSVDADVVEADAGDVIVSESGSVLKKVKEDGVGSIVVDGSVGDDVQERGDGDVTIGATATVAGHVTEDGEGSVVVGGIVQGEIVEEHEGDLVIEADASVARRIQENGPGSVVVDGFVDDEVEEKDAGNVSIGSTATVSNRVKESGDGSVVVSGIVRDDVIEQDAGDLTIEAGSTVDGLVTESGTGSVIVRGTVGGTIDEQGTGDLRIEPPASVSAEVKEKDAGSLFIATSIGASATEDHGGDLIVSPSVTVGGNVTEKKDGNLSIGAAAHVTGDADSEDPGTCSIDPTAAIDGLRLGECA